jgi:tetratricopeptide (TPR) repeat protein
MTKMVLHYWFGVSVGVLLGLAEIGGTAAAYAQPEQLPAGMLQALLREADAAIEARDRELARELYKGLLLEFDPDNSRAIFQLARLAPAGSYEALAFFRRYVALEPRDNAGRMALGDALAKAGAIDAALREYDRAQREGPDDDDVYRGRGRILRDAGRIGGLVRNDEQWVSRRPANAEAWRELGRSRMRAQRPIEAAEAFARSLNVQDDARTRAQLKIARAESGAGMRVYFSHGKDSDDVRGGRRGVEGDWPLGKRTRCGLHVERNAGSDPTRVGSAEELALLASWQPSASQRLDMLGGAAWLRADQPGGESAIHPLAKLRWRWKGPLGAPAADLRFTWTPLVSNPGLLAKPVELIELSGRLEHPLFGPLHVRLAGQQGALREATQTNHRSGFQLGAIHRWRSGAEIGLLFNELAYARRSASAYSAPHRLRGVELGVYLETEFFWPVSIQLDAGTGRQRVTRFGEPPREGTGQSRLWASIGWAFVPGGRLELEYEYNNSPLGGAGVTPTTTWRYNAVLLTLRFGIPIRPA